MKKVLILSVSLALALSASAQGIFNGNTAASQIGTAGKIFRATVADGQDGTAATSTEEAQWYIAPAATTGITAVANKNGDVTGAQAVGSVTVFKTGSQAGYITPGSITTTYAGGSTVTVQLKAWSISGGSTWETQLSNPAGFSQESAAYQVVGLTTGIATPPQVVGFKGFNLTANTPEPSTIALGVLGLSVLLFRRRK
jgi:hypothetical protein